MKVLALLFVGTGALAYSCSGDDIFEEEEDARSLAKRAMQTRGEKQCRIPVQLKRLNQVLIPEVAMDVNVMFPFRGQEGISRVILRNPN